MGFLGPSHLRTACTKVTLCLPLAELHLSRKLGDYGVTVPCSTDFRGRFLSHVVSGPAAASEGNAAVARPPAPPSHPGHLRVARSPLRPEGATRSPGRAGRYSLYFNITVFGEELHLRLQPNRRLVVPGASAEWQEDFEEVFRQPLQRECVYTGGVTGMPGAAVAISNCDGLVRDKPFLKLRFAPCPSPWLLELGRPVFLLGSPMFGTPVGTLWGLGQVRGYAAFHREPHSAALLCQVRSDQVRIALCISSPSADTPGPQLTWQGSLSPDTGRGKEVGSAGIESWLCSSPAMRLWTSYLLSLWVFPVGVK